MLLVAISIISCTIKKPVEISVNYKSGMMEADREFSKMSEEKGIKKASMHYIDDKGVLLRPFSVPLVGGNAVDFISQGNDSSYLLTWEPSGGNVARSGDMGYTYGSYSRRSKNKDIILYGTYTRIWKRLDDGKWKFVLETGNEGIE